MKKYVFLSTFFCLACTSCSFQPEYRRPSLDIPDSWRFEPEDGSTDFGDSQDLFWWNHFNDPVLTGLVTQALANNQDLKAAIARVYEAAALVGIAQSALFPTITGNGFASRQELSLSTSPPPPTIGRINNTYAALLNFSYEVDVWGKIRSLNDAALAQFLATDQARRTVLLTLVSSVATSYLQLRIFDKQLEIGYDTIKSREESYRLAQLKFQGGTSSELPVRQSESEMEGTRAEVTRLELLVALQENLICVLLGEVPRPIERGTDLFRLKAPALPLDLPSSVIAQRPDILQAEQQMIAANAEVGVAIAELFPDFSLTGYYGNESFKLHNLFTGPTRTWQYAINVVQVIFDAGRLAYQVDEAEAVTWETVCIYRQTVLTAFREVEDALITLQKSVELQEVQERRVNALGQYLRLANLQYNNGQTDYLNVLDAQRSLFTAQLDLVQAHGDSLVSVVALYKSFGGPWVDAAETYRMSDPGDSCIQSD